MMVEKLKHQKDMKRWIISMMLHKKVQSLQGTLNDASCILIFI